MQTRAAEGDEWSPVAVIVAVGEDDHLGELKIVGMEGSKQPVPTPGLGSVKPEQKDAKSSVSQWQERRDWGLGDLTVQCNKGKCQVNMGDIPVLLIEPNCTDTDGMKCTVTAPGGLSKKKRTDFLKEAVDKFESQMTKQTVSQEWNQEEADGSLGKWCAIKRDHSRTLESAMYQHVQGVARHWWAS